MSVNSTNDAFLFHSSLLEKKLVCVFVCLQVFRKSQMKERNEWRSVMP